MSNMRIWKMPVIKSDRGKDEMPDPKTQAYANRPRNLGRIVQSYRSLDGTTWSSVREDVFKRALRAAVGEK